MKSILYFGADKELENKIENIAYASGADDFQAVDNLNGLVTTLGKKDISMLIVDTEVKELMKLKKPQKIILLIDVLARSIVDEDISKKTVVILKPFTQKSLLDFFLNDKQ